MPVKWPSFATICNFLPTYYCFHLHSYVHTQDPVFAIIRNPFLNSACKVLDIQTTFSCHHISLKIVDIYKILLSPSHINLSLTYYHFHLQSCMHNQHPVSRPYATLPQISLSNVCNILPFAIICKQGFINILPKFSTSQQV